MSAPRLKVMTIVGTRPELIKLSRVIAELDAHADHVLVHSGQNSDYELNEIFFQELGIRRPDHVLDAVGATAAETIGLVIAKADSVLEREHPDAVLLYGDTNTCLAVIAAKRRKVPVFHMEAGNRCFDQRVPEEINRKIVDHLADVNLTITEHARRYLLAEGIRPETVIKVGSSMGEVLDAHKAGIEGSDVLERMGLRAREYFVVSAHREENVDPPDRLSALLATLESLATTYGHRVIVSTHPRARRRLEALPDERHRALDERIEFLKPFGFFDYIHLQSHALCVLSDSGTLTEEASLLGFPAVMLRDAHERPEGMDEGTVIMAGLDAARVEQAVRVAVAHAARGFRPRVVADYEASDVATKVVRIILSHVDYVNHTVWHKRS